MRGGTSCLIDEIRPARSVVRPFCSKSTNIAVALGGKNPPKSGGRRAWCYPSSASPAQPHGEGGGGHAGKLYLDTGYQNTISGLLRKRGEMLANFADLREHIAVLSNDLESIERVIETLALCVCYIRPGTGKPRSRSCAMAQNALSPPLYHTPLRGGFLAFSAAQDQILRLTRRGLTRP